MPTLAELLVQVDSSVSDIVELEQSLVQIPSVNSGFMPTGDETPVCKFVQEWLAEDGINSEILESAPNRGNIVAQLEGSSGDPGLMFVSHTDVVPVEDQSKWSFEPFAGTIANGRVYGRGASDCKALLAAQMMAVRILKRNDIKLDQGLLLVSFADEEHGGRYGAGWMAEHYPEKITAPYAINEGGGQPADAAGNLAYVVNLGEKGRLQVEVEIKGVSAHASTPWQGTNAMYRLTQVLQRIEGYEPERDTSAAIFDHLSKFAIEDVPTAENIDEIVQDLEETDPNMASTLRASSRMTLTPTIIQGGIKSNSVPESIHVTCDVRTLPHQDDAYLRTELIKLFDGIPGVDFDIDYMAVPNASEFDTPLMDHVREATEFVLGDRSVEWIPGLCVGFTDSRFTRPLGVVTYGFSGSHPDDNPMEENVHGTDESISIRTLITSTKIMLALAYNMLAAK